MAARLHGDWMLMWLLGASTFKGFVCRHPPAGPGGQRKRSLGTGGPQTIQEVSGSPWASEICFCALFSTPSILLSKGICSYEEIHMEFSTYVEPSVKHLCHKTTVFNQYVTTPLGSNTLSQGSSKTIRRHKYLYYNSQ